MNCPNCGAPTKSSTCEYCKTEQAPAARTVVNTGGGLFIGGGMIKVGGNFTGRNSVTVNGRPVKPAKNDSNEDSVTITGDFVGRNSIFRR